MHQVEFFRSLEFTVYESRVLSSLTKMKCATPKQITVDSGVPQNKIYAILKTFNELGILATYPTEPKKYSLINLKTFIDNKIEKKQHEIAEIKKSSKNIETLTSHQDFVFSLIKGQKAIMNRIAENAQSVKKEILGVQRNWKIWGGGLREMEKSIKKGVKVKLIGEINNETKKRASEWKKIGCKIHAYNKNFGDYPLRFSIFDNKEARITIGKPEISDPKDYITIWTTSRPLINTLRKQFNQMWKETDAF